ncbi:hypothetical protein ECANGB1_1158 [Enterospora canceri]|uniref:Uncharacterized protein n=1 Tax=Enterospora canceri TaxID=1081671 RepID=A0A1Y1S6J7_9MICR|nr:hypothetical protein ECANGB1_1158 [Enterospora canceri]
MDQGITLKHTFTYNGVTDAYEITFEQDKIAIKSASGTVDEIPYEKLHKIKYSCKMLKLAIEGKKTIKIPITKKEMEMLENILVASKVEAKRDRPIGAALVFFGDESFYISLHSMDLNELKRAILRRISQVFYPAIGCDNVDLDNFKNFKFYAKHDINSSIIESETDLEAALVFHSNKLIIQVVLNK